jgi:hypothetical protein
VGTGSTPSDIHGAVSPVNIVVVTNRDIGVYDRASCTRLSRVSFDVFFGASFTIAPGEGLFDPRVLYDTAAGRFFVEIESRNTTPGNTDQFQYFAVSTDNTGTSWSQYRVALS